MKTKLALLALLFTAGCAYQTANQYDIEEAQQLCMDKGGIAEITITFAGDEYVLCKDNSHITLHKKDN